LSLVTLDFVANRKALTEVSKLLIIGSSERLAEAGIDDVPAAIWSALLDDLKGGDMGGSRSTVTGREDVKTVAVGVLPAKAARNVSPSRAHAVAELVRGQASGKGNLGILCLLDADDHLFASAMAIARAFPEFSKKTGEKEEPRAIKIAFEGPKAKLKANSRVVEGARSVRSAAAWLDMPCADLDTTVFTEIATDVAKECGAEIEVIAGTALKERGYGGLWTVGKAAESLPALVILKHEPKGAKKNICWIGKGVVYDTGGLNIKVGGNMFGMKSDMGGAGAILGAFRACALSGFKENLYAILCLAENAVDAKAGRPDDIFTQFSGKTVEVNNTDAEGRLVLADGLAHAVKYLNPDVLLDMATLTGAQLMATGRRHAALYCNDDELEAKAMAAGKSSGDLTSPLPYAPEFFRADYKSTVADLRNTTSDRMNASSASAGWFLSEHLGDYSGPWIHVDVAGPVSHKDRGTGFGVALLMDMFH
jgi:probable aminopeptidase NPEPL1